MKVVSLKQTCSACPTQYEGKLDDGRMIYVRYRWGYLSIRVSPAPTNNVMDAVEGEEVFGKGMGGDYDGFTLYKEIIEATFLFIEWPDKYS